MGLNKDAEMHVWLEDEWSTQTPQLQFPCHMHMTTILMHACLYHNLAILLMNHTSLASSPECSPAITWACLTWTIWRTTAKYFSIWTGSLTEKYNLTRMYLTRELTVMLNVTNTDVRHCLFMIVLLFIHNWVYVPPVSPSRFSCIFQVYFSVSFSFYSFYYIFLLSIFFYFLKNFNCIISLKFTFSNQLSFQASFILHFLN